MSPRSEETECPECGTGNPIHSKFCETCGLRLVTKHVRDEGRSSRRSAVRAGKQPARVHDSERRDVERALGRARVKLKSIRTLLIVLTVLNVAITLLVWAGGPESSKFDPAIFNLVLIVSASVSALLLCATVFLYDHPLFWVVTVASLCTVATILAPGILSIIVCVSLWGSLPLILDVTRLQREHPDLITKESLRRRKTPRLSGESAARIEARAAARRNQAIRSYSVVAAIVLFGLAAVLWAPKGSSAHGRSSAPGGMHAPKSSMAELAAREQEFADVRARFETAWVASNYPDVEALGSKEYLERRSYKVKDILDRRGWARRFPPIAFEAVVSRSADTREVWFTITPRGKLKTHWVYEGGGWKVRRIVFSRTR